MLWGTSALERRVEMLEQRMRRLDEIVRDLCARSGIDPTALAEAPNDPTGLDETEVQLAHSGRAIEAIKHHRQRTGSSLRHAKNTVAAVLRR